MPALTPASEVILRHADEFISRRVLFAGDLHDQLPCQLTTKNTRVWTTHYHHWQLLADSLAENVQFSLLADPEFTRHCDTLIYYWPKSKQEAQFQLYHLLSQLPAGAEFFVVGENRSGVRSVEPLLEANASICKIDSARRCGLYHVQLNKPISFDINQWWHHYQHHGVTISALPGVFSRDALDAGSQLLLSVLGDNLQGDLLDVGCGAGVLTALLAKRADLSQLTLCDSSAAALESSRVTLADNGLTGNIIASNVFSNIEGRFNLIISNPPFHDGLQTSLLTAEALIRGAVDHLHIGGKLCIVANAFLPYPDWLDAAFGNHELLAQTGKFKVYQAVRMRPSAPQTKKKKR